MMPATIHHPSEEAEEETRLLNNAAGRAQRHTENGDYQKALDALAAAEMRVEKARGRVEDAIRTERIEEADDGE